MFRKILVANRGEIACRIIRSIHAMGMKAVAVVSHDDQDALHGAMADEVVSIGASPALESYLVVEKIIEAAKKTKSDALHPGYGFLSENSLLPKILEKHKITFIGPPTKAIMLMGDKLRSREIAEKAGLPIISGSSSSVKSVNKVLKVAKDIGYPIMIKAAAGGGGKGMRVVREEKDLEQAFESTTREAKSSFGDARVFVERFIESPRHIEIQVLADTHGNAIHLGERECSIQRRNQKIIEEQPSVFVTAQMREKMGAAALSLVKKVGYYSAGTVEFLVDAKKRFYFLEMNTRLQVEHPVTEMTNNIDLVEWMIRIAMGEKLSLKQKDVQQHGWAIEARIYSEDPFQDCLPSIGYLSRYIPPKTGIVPSSGATIRHDTGVMEGGRVSMYYDPLLAKLIAHADSRTQALNALKEALDCYVINGVKHNIPMISALLGHPYMQDGNLSTDFILRHYPYGFENLAKTTPEHPTMETLAQIAGILFLRKEQRYGLYQKENQILSVKVFGKSRLKKKKKPWAVTAILQKHDAHQILEKDSSKKKNFSMTFNEETGIVRLFPLEGYAMKVLCTMEEDGWYRLSYRGFVCSFLPLSGNCASAMAYMKDQSKRLRDRTISSPMPGLVVAIHVKPGQIVKSGDNMIVIEAMKMENVLSVNNKAQVETVFCKVGDHVKTGQKLIQFTTS